MSEQNQTDSIRQPKSQFFPKGDAGRWTDLIENIRAFCELMVDQGGTKNLDLLTHDNFKQVVSDSIEPALRKQRDEITRFLEKGENKIIEDIQTIIISQAEIAENKHKQIMAELGSLVDHVYSIERSVKKLNNYVDSLKHKKRIKV